MVVRGGLVTVMESTVVQPSVCLSVSPSLQPSTVDGMTLGPRVRRAVPPAPVRGRWYPISSQYGVLR